MTNLKLILFFLLTTFSLAHAQTKQKEDKLLIGFAMNPITKIDYYYLSYGSKSIYTFLPDGLDLNINLSKGRQTAVFGTITGILYNYPFRFYLGYNFRVSPKAWKVEVLASCKNMVYYKRTKSVTGESTFRDIESYLGGIVQTSCGRCQLGLSYYGGFHSFKFTRTSNSSPSTAYSYSDSGYSRLGLLSLNINFIIFSRPTHNSKSGASRTL